MDLHHTDKGKVKFYLSLTKYKGKVKFYLSLTKYHAMKTYPLFNWTPCHEDESLT